jgi:hypothetical protein
MPTPFDWGIILALVPLLLMLMALYFEKELEKETRTIKPKNDQEAQDLQKLLDHINQDCKDQHK